ncbi:MULTISPECIES: hypothetical protein [unclassified Sphingomonas]|uniref:hypothetical protein n=1 Tax=unclassified Sphingomonas TaxID=196159 RepID=UPI000E741FEF|nr:MULTISPECIES: hypothetical protein [unclassified Sphingomonas]RKE53374.1 hypothetical protein C8J39_0518 [Sphingomonas sp. PP-CC-1A-547]TCM09869.1 hypothetical protein C8J41_101375 [Sphingomonas sp. PP-CC-3G-468]
MKFTHLIAAGLAFATLGLGAAAPAEAQRGHSQQYRDNDHRGDHRDHRGDRRNYRHNDHRGDRHDDRRWRGRDHDRRNWNNNRRCRTEWRHNRRVQICR